MVPIVSGGLWDLSGLAGHRLRSDRRLHACHRRPCTHRSCCAKKARSLGSAGMGDSYGVVKVAAVQAASVFLDREGSTEKACRLIREAGKNGARVIGFPEGFIPAHPVWYHHHAATGAIANKLAVELFKNSVEIPGPETDALVRGRARRQRLCGDRRVRETPEHHRHDVQHPALHRPGRHAHPQAPEDHADGRRAARAHGRLRRHLRRVSRANSGRCRG